MLGNSLLCPEHCRTFSGIPGFCPTYSKPVPLFQKIIKKCLQSWPNVPWGWDGGVKNHPWMRTTGIESFQNMSFGVRLKFEHWLCDSGNVFLSTFNFLMYRMGNNLCFIGSSWETRDKVREASGREYLAHGRQIRNSYKSSGTNKSGGSSFISDIIFFLLYVKPNWSLKVTTSK